eukprot:CAMPEP_0206184100 /NCGR_PEP_ID=MMETSP0166-20121206/1026_1 /ASSEMBLY_ACC=CAM_ASM_000260 /TAXON_ID=95228 /ORGANISM="Vannella robusta, Strain DIVA3 518/3/11/1/6" /LENGTH=168 /DNA_ID=CAMNT_0053599069 /DNA_START=252 /DNA_END=755 /DNA_ORIENTATION=-
MGNAEAFVFVKERLDLLFELLQSFDVLSLHSQQLLQALVVYLGSFLLRDNEENQAQKQAPAPVLVDILSGSGDSSVPATVSHPSASDGVTNDTIALYFIEKLANVKGVTWGAPLIQFTVKQVEKFHILATAVSELNQHPDTLESEYMSLLSQFPWSQLGEFTTVKAMQ